MCPHLSAGWQSQVMPLAAVALPGISSGGRGGIRPAPGNGQPSSVQVLIYGSDSAQDAGWATGRVGGRGGGRKRRPLGGVEEGQDGEKDDEGRRKRDQGSAGKNVELAF